MSNVALLHSEALWVLPPALALIIFLSRFLRGLAPARRNSALVLQCLSAFLLVLSLSQPVLLKPDDKMSLVVVLDSSASLSQPSRDSAVAFAKELLNKSRTPNSGTSIRFVSVASEARELTAQEVISGTWSKPDDAAQAGNSDLAAGLRLANSFLRAGGKRRVVLLSDGWETRGAAADEAASIMARGIDVQVMALTALGEREVVLESVTLPGYARVGDSIATEVHLFSTTATDSTLQVSIDGGAPQPRQATLRPGENTVPLEQTATAEGFHRIDVTVRSPDDTSTENNTAAGSVVVKPQPRVLVLEDRAGEADRLVEALSGRRMIVEKQTPATIPSKPDELDGYDAIVLNNVAATSMSLDQQRTLQEYVRRNGRGLVVVGGQTSYAKGGYSDSPLEDVLPVSSQPAPRPEKGAVALILVLDRSFSMDEYGNHNPDEPSKFAMAKEAARLAVDAVREGDTLGVLTFDTTNLWVVPPKLITGTADKEQAKTAIANIELGGGTEIFGAVQEAIDAIRPVQAKTKHIVLLTDGQDHHSIEYPPLLAKMQSEGTTLSTIAIGVDADRDLLTELAKLGQGRYYLTEHPENIPKVVFKELDLALKEAVVEGSVQPHVSAPSPVLHGFAPQDIPQLSGYDITIAKEGAVIGLVSDDGKPILSHWNYGLGRVVAFTSDGGLLWARKWNAWSEFGRFWDQAVRWSMASPVNKLLQPSVSVRENSGAYQVGEPGGGPNIGTLGHIGTPGPVAHISAESLRADNTFADLQDITVGLRSPSGVVTSTLMSQTGPGRYEADAPVGEQGAYEVRLSRVGDGATESASFSVAASQELVHAGINERLLKKINGGKPYISTAGEALDRTGLQGTSPDAQPLWPYLLPPALILLLMSVAFRRIDVSWRGRRG